MSLVVETGSGVDDAESYASVAEVRAYAEKRGLALSAGDAAVEIACRKAFDYLETLSYKGSKVNALQDSQWPREGVYIEDSEDEFPTDEIPKQLVNANCQLACEADAGTDLQPTGEGREVVREKVDVIETEYAKSGSGSVSPEFNKAMAMLAPLLEGGGSFSLQAVRV